MPNSISIQGCKSLSDIKKKLKLETQLKEPEQIFNRKITITADSVIIGKKIYPITNRTANKYEYPSIRVTLSNGKRQWLKLDTLRALL